MIHVLREIQHDAQQRQLSDSDHVTKHDGGTPTVPKVNHKTAGANTHTEMGDVARAATGCHN